MKTLTPVPASTSTAGTALTEAVDARLVKVGLRRKGATLQGVRVQSATLVTLPDGTDRRVAVGDWLIYQGPYLLAICPDADFPGATYEVVAEGTLMLTIQDRELLEATVGIGATRSVMTLVAAVQRLARIKIGDVTVPFTPGQLEELKLRADKRGQTVAQAIKAVVDRIRDELFWRG